MISVPKNQIQEILMRETSDELQLIFSKVEQLASPADITNTLGFRRPPTWLLGRTPEFQTFTDS